MTNYGLSTVNEVVDRVCAEMALRLVDVAVHENLVPPNSSIGFTGRAAISGNKPYLIVDGITERGIYDDPIDHLVFVDDGLGRGQPSWAGACAPWGSRGTPSAASGEGHVL